jgi:beta-phosphoglucomutase-like phosphatase (HAD superfamily)
MAIRGVLLDVDGTPVLSNDAQAHAWVAALAEYGYTVAYDRVRPLIGLGGATLLPKLVPGRAPKKASARR